MNKKMQEKRDMKSKELAHSLTGLDCAGLLGFEEGFNYCHDLMLEEMKLLAQAIENYCNAHYVWGVNKNHMLYQGSNEQQFIDALAHFKERFGGN